YVMGAHTGPPPGLRIRQIRSCEDRTMRVLAVVVFAAISTAAGCASLVSDPALHCAACGYASAATTMDATASPFVIAVTPSALAVAAGSTGTAAVTVTRAGGFDEAVSIDLTGLPDGVTAQPLAIAKAAGGGALVFSVAPSAAPNDGTVLVTGTATDGRTSTATLAFSVPSAGDDAGSSGDDGGHGGPDANVSDAATTVNSFTLGKAHT